MSYKHHRSSSTPDIRVSPLNEEGRESGAEIPVWKVGVVHNGCELPERQHTLPIIRASSHALGIPSSSSRKLSCGWGDKEEGQRKKLMYDDNRGSGTLTRFVWDFPGYIRVDGGISDMRAIKTRHERRNYRAR